MSKTLACLALPILLAGKAAAFETPVGDPERGRLIAKQNCAACHSIERSGDSPYKPAPPFRTLPGKYPVQDIAESLAEGIMVGHEGKVQMPELVFQPQEIEDLIAFIESLAAPPR